MNQERHLDRSIAGGFKFAIALTALTLVAEVAGGIYTSSLALLSDAAHVFLDLFALVLSLAAIKLASYPSSEIRTFGWHRAEVFASFINGGTVFLMAIGIFIEAWGRLFEPVAIKSLPMFVIATLGLFTNLLAASALHRHSHDDLNVKSAFLHVIGDALTSVGVIVAGVIIYFTGWFILDPVASVLIGSTIFWGAWRVLRESTHILLEGTPRGLETSDVVDSILKVDGVRNLHHLNIWTICSHIMALSAHIDVKPEFQDSQSKVLRAIEEILFEKYHISHTTLQVECACCENAPLIRDLCHLPRTNGNGCDGHDHDHDQKHGH
jgi:cobalt-zinc-cadmium efflux system protein